MNPMNDVPASVYVKKISGKPTPPKSLATLAKFPKVMLNGINPARIPAKSYIKK